MQKMPNSFIPKISNKLDIKFKQLITKIADIKIIKGM